MESQIDKNEHARYLFLIKATKLPKLVETFLLSKKKLKKPDWRYSVIIQHDNVRPHIANMTIHAKKVLGCEVLPHRILLV